MDVPMKKLCSRAIFSRAIIVSIWIRNVVRVAVKQIHINIIQCAVCIFTLVSMSDIPDKIGRLSLTLNDSISKVDRKGVLIKFTLTSGFRSGESTDCPF